MIVGKITTLEQLERKLAEQRRKIAAAVKPFAGDTPERQRKRLRRAKKDRLYFYRTYLPHYFTKRFNWHHKEIDEACDFRQGTISLIFGGRETGKSVIAAVGYPVHQGCFNLRNFTIIVSLTEDLAAERLIAIRAEFESNPRIIADFGRLENPGLWEMDDFTLRSGSRYKALGYGGHIRGKISGPHRPDLIIPEDIENQQTARNPKRSAEIKQYLLEEAYGTLGQEGNMVCLFNMPGKYSVANQFRQETEQGMRDGKFLGRRFILWFPLEMRENETFPNGSRFLWPEQKGEDFCLRLKQTVGTIAYQREYMLQIISEGRIFKESWFREYKQAPPILRAILYSDPAFGQTKHSSMKGILLLGWSGNKYIALDAWLRHESITAWIDAQYAIWKRWRDAGLQLYNHFVDDNFEQLERLKHDYNQAAERHGWRIPLTSDKFHENKTAKIEALAGLIENGSFEFDFGNPDQRELREHLIYFPDHIYTEGGDLLASAKRCLDNSSANVEVTSIWKRTFQRLRFNA